MGLHVQDTAPAKLRMMTRVVTTLLLQNSRKTDCGAKQCLTSPVVRAAAFALLAAAVCPAQYKAQPSGDPPSEVAPAILATLNKAGTKIIAPNGSTFVEIWLRSAPPTGPNSSEQGVTLPMLPVGALLGVLRFPGKGADRRGQPIAAGVYTVRYGNHPINGDHQGVAPQRDFLVLAPASADQKVDTVPDFDSLMALSKKASGSTHPAVLSFWKADSDFKPGFEKQGETDWVLQVKFGDLPIAIILVGKAEG
jgi:hypothetical protein